MANKHSQFISQTPLTYTDYATIAPLFGFANGEAMQEFAEGQEARARVRAAGILGETA